MTGSRLRVFGGALGGAIRGAGASWTDRRGALLELDGGDGKVGRGEASPLPGYSPDTFEACLAALVQVRARFDPSMKGDALEALSPLLEGVPAARFATETAILDLAAQRADRSMAEQLGGRGLVAIDRSGLAQGEDLAGLVSCARGLLDRGVSTIKIKVGVVSLDREVALLEALRRDLGFGFTLRLDANGAWTLDEARRALGRFAPLRVELVEEPVRGALLRALGETAVPWAADESLVDPEVARWVLDEAPPGCAAVVLKPALLGGLLRARTIALAAQARGLGVIVTHLFDGPVALAAACELALSLPTRPLACGLDPHLGLAAWPHAQLPQLARAGLVVPSGLAGLGLAGWGAS